MKIESKGWTLIKEIDGISLCLVARENQLLQRAFNVSMRDLFLGDILSHCVREGEVAGSVRELLRQ